MRNQSITYGLNMISEYNIRIAKFSKSKLKNYHYLSIALFDTKDPI